MEPHITPRHTTSGPATEAPPPSSATDRAPLRVTPRTSLDALRRLGPPASPPNSPPKSVTAPNYDDRDTLWINETNLGPILENLDGTRVTSFAVVGEEATRLGNNAIPKCAQLLIAYGPLRHEAGATLYIKSKSTQELLFSGELRYPIDLEPDGSVLLLLATPDETHNTDITSPQIYTGRFVSPQIGSELNVHTRRELPHGQELLPPTSL